MPRTLREADIQLVSRNPQEASLLNAFMRLQESPWVRVCIGELYDSALVREGGHSDAGAMVIEWVLDAPGLIRTNASHRGELLNALNAAPVFQIPLVRRAGGSPDLVRVQLVRICYQSTRHYWVARYVGAEQRELVLLRPVVDDDGNLCFRRVEVLGSVGPAFALLFGRFPEVPVPGAANPLREVLLRPVPFTALETLETLLVDAAEGVTENLEVAEALTLVRALRNPESEPTARALRPLQWMRVDDDDPLPEF